MGEAAPALSRDSKPCPSVSQSDGKGDVLEDQLRAPSGNAESTRDPSSSVSASQCLPPIAHLEIANQSAWIKF